MPTRTAANSAGQPAYTFDLSTLTESERTGYGFAVVGAGLYQGNAIAVSEISATALRVADTGVIAPQPFFVQWTNNHRYALSIVRSDWEQAEASAVVAGGHLVAINDAAENDFLGSVFGRQELLSIGLKQPPTASEPAQEFAWSNGEALTFTNWHPGEPNNSGVGGADEDYVFMNYQGGATGTWIDAINSGLTGSCRGIIELPTSGAGEQGFYLREISAKSNIFDAGLASATQGGVLPPSLAITGLAGQLVTFPQIVGVLNTGVDVHGPDGAHTAGRSCDLTGVGGISGYLNGNNTPALVGVFLGAAQPAQQPERLDFSTSALGENFTLLAPALGQVFFIGDGFTSTGQAQEFIIPAGAERLYVGFPDGSNGTFYHGTPLGYGDNSGSMSLRATVASIPTPVILTADFPGAGGKLEAAGGSGADYTWAIIAGALPPHLHLNTDGTIVLTIEPRMNGTFPFTVQATDASGPGQQQFTIVIADPVDVPSGIVAWWPGDNGVNDIIGDRHGAFRNVAFDTPAIQNGSAFRAGTVGRGFAFDGVNDCIEVADHDSLDITGDLTIEAWVKATATSGERTIVSKRDGSNANVTYVLFARDGELRFGSRTGGGAYSDIGSGANLPAGFSHVAATISGTSLKFFINGEEVGASSIPARPATSGPLTIGGTVTDTFPASSPDGPWSGVIDELSLYNRALTAGEISTLYAAGAGGKKRADAARDFSPTQNPAGVWSYLELPSTASLANYNKDGAVRMTTNGVAHSGRVDFWNTSAAVGRNNSQDFIVIPSGGSQYDYNVAELSWGPGPGSQMPVVRWTAPIGGRYAVSANFTNTDTTPSSTDVFIRHGSTAIFDSFVTPYRGNGVSHTSTITAAADDTVDFILGTRGNWTYDSAAISASVVFLGIPLVIVETEFPTEPSEDGPPWELTASGGSGSYSFSITAGALPAHIELAASGPTAGTISRVPGATPVVGHYDFTVTVSDGQQTAQRAFSVVVAEEVPLPANILAWFPGELHAHDIVAGINATTSNVTYGAGKVGRAFVLNGTDQSVEATSDVLNRLPLTIEAWVKPEVRSDGTASDLFPANIVCNDKQNFGGVGIGANVFSGGSSLWLELKTSNPADAHHRVPGVNLTVGKWTHVALVLTSGNAKTYVDGALVESFDFSQGAADGDTTVRIGRHNNDSGFGTRRFFKGAIDEITIYENALTAAEILGIYNADAIGKERYDAARDFFALSNSVGQRWQYGVMNAGATPDVSTFARYDEVVSENVIRAWRTTGTVDPNVIKNVGATPYFHWQPGRLSAHPGNAGSGTSGKYSAVRWTAPAAGSYAVASTFLGLNGATGQATTTSVHLRHNSTVIANGTVSDYNVDHPFFAKVNANTTDTVDFIVGPNGSGDFDATGLNPTVVLLAPAAEITTTTFPLAGTGRRIEPQGAGYIYSIVAGALPPGITLAADGTVLGAPTQNGEFTFIVRLTRNGVSTQREFTVNVTDVPPPPPVGATTLFTLKANGKVVRAGVTVRQDSQFVFKATQLAHPSAAGLRVVVQYSSTPAVEASWENLSDSRMDRKRDGDTAWTLTTRLMPAGTNLYFRTRTLATGFTASPGPVPNDTVVPIGPVAITPTPVIETTFTAKTTSRSGAVTDATGTTMRPDDLILYKIRVKNVGSAPALKLIAGMTIPDAAPVAKSLKGKTLEYAGSPDTTRPMVEVLDAKGNTLNPTGSEANARKVQINFAKTGAQLAPNASAEFSFWVGLRSAFIATRPFQKTIAATGVFAGYDGKLAEPVDKSLETVILPPVKLELTTTPTGIVQRGQFVIYTLTAVNESADDLTSVKATFTVPRGTSVVLLGGPDGNDFTGPAQNTDPQETINPSLTPYDYGRKQTITWTLGNLPGTASNLTMRTRKLNVLLQVQHDVPHTEVDANGTFHTAEIVADDYNLTYTPPSGGSIAVFDGNAPRVARGISAELLVRPPTLGVDKTAVGDLVFRNATVAGDPSFRGDVVGVREENNITYQLNYHNSGADSSDATRCTVEDRIPNGLTFVGFLKISRDGNPANEEELLDADYRFFDAKGKLLSGDPWFDDGNGKFDFTDTNRNRRHDPGEPSETFIDVDLDKKYTPRGDITKTRIIVFNVGRLNAGERGYIRYQCKPSGEPGAVIASGAYALRTESLREPIQGSTAVTYAKIVRVPAFDVQTQPSRNSVSPNDAPGDPTALANATVDYDVTFRNVSGVSARGKLTFDIPTGLTLVDGSQKLFNAAGAQVGTVELLPEGKPTTMLRCTTPVIGANQEGHLRFTCRALPSAQIASTVDAFQSKATLESATLSSPVRHGITTRVPLRHSIADIKNTASDSSTVRLVAASRAELWGMKAVLMSQETRRDLSYMIVAGNGGDSAAKNVEVAVAIPAARCS